jgi:peptidylprolyl isomerase
MTEAKSGDTVRIHYTGKLTDGTEFDSSSGGEPLEFELGAGQIIPGLEREIVGMQVGDASTITVPADAAYGPHREDAVRTVPRSAIPANIELAVGGRLQATTQEGQQVQLTVVSMDAETVTLDSNHPLAGQDLVFDVELVDIV